VGRGVGCFPVFFTGFSVGLVVGRRDLVGLAVGDSVFRAVGLADGFEDEGLEVGCSVVGVTVGWNVVIIAVGSYVGCCEGLYVGLRVVPDAVAGVVGFAVGLPVGLKEGFAANKAVTCFSADLKMDWSFTIRG
jgi:hypothetical protein